MQDGWTPLVVSVVQTVECHIELAQSDQKNREEIRRHILGLASSCQFHEQPPGLNCLAGACQHMAKKCEMRRSWNCRFGKLAQVSQDVV